MFGWLVSLAIVVTVAVLATGNNPPQPNTAPSLASLAIKIALGVVLVVIAVRHIRARSKPKPPKKPPKWQEHVDSMSPWFALVLAPALQPWALISAGAATVVEAKLSSWENFLALILYCVLASSSYLAMQIYAMVRPSQSQQMLARFRAWIDAHTDQAIIGGSLIIGLYAHREGHLPDRHLRLLIVVFRQAARGDIGVRGKGPESEIRRFDDLGGGFTT